MDPNNSLTGDPNQKFPSSPFGFDPYTAQNLHQSTQSWTQNVPNSNIPFYNAIPLPQPTTSQFSSQSQTVPSTFSFGPQRSNDSLVQFPFNITTNEYGTTSFFNARGKRKTESEPLRPRKQHITEEKMADYMSKLHINSETAPTEMESDLAKEKRLYMCEEMRKLQTESALPSCLLQNIKAPCTALVLWKPPTRVFPLLLGNTSDSSEVIQLKDNNSSQENDMEEMENDSLGVQNNMDMEA